MARRVFPSGSLCEQIALCHPRLLHGLLAAGRRSRACLGSTAMHIQPPRRCRGILRCLRELHNPWQLPHGRQEGRLETRGVEGERFAAVAPALQD